MRTTHAGLFTALCTILAACSAPGTAPVDTAVADLSAPASASAPKFWETNAVADWNEFAVTLTSAGVVDPYRLHAYLALAQLRAVQAAATTTPHPPLNGAIGGASVAILTSFFPTRAAEFEARLDAQAATTWPGGKHQDFAAGEALGRQVAAEVLDYAAGDRVGLADPGLPPATPGSWIYNGFLVRGFYGARPFFLASGNEFLPPPPPAFGSPAFQTALQEVIDIAADRTAEQLAIANYWNVNQSGVRNVVWNRLAVDLMRRYRVGEAESARILFLMNAATVDALVGCFNAKYTYWFIRPPQAAPLATVFPPPPHPSYPSAHSCVSGAASGVLANAFPSEARHVEELAIEASLSRLYAGIHYRFDMEAGLALGRSVAAKALAADLSPAALTP